MNIDFSTTASSLLLRTGQTQQEISITLMKRAADQQKQIADLLAQNARTVTSSSNGNGFSTYA